MSENLSSYYPDNPEVEILKPIDTLRTAILEVRMVIENLETVSREKWDDKYEDVSGYYSLHVALRTRSEELWNASVVFIESYARIIWQKEFSTVRQYLSWVRGMLQEDYTGEIETRVLRGFMVALEDVMMIVPSVLDDHQKKATEAVDILLSSY